MRRRIEEPFLTAAGGGGCAVPAAGERVLAPAFRRRGGSVAAPGSVLVLWRQGVRAMGTRGVVAGCRGRLSFSAWGLAPSWHLACARRGPASLRPGVGAVAAHAAPHPATSSCCFWRSGPRIALRYSWRPTTLRGSVGRPPVGLQGGWEAAGPNFKLWLTWILTCKNGPRPRPLPYPYSPRLRPLPNPLFPRLRPSPNALFPRLRPPLRPRPTRLRPTRRLRPAPRLVKRCRQPNDLLCETNHQTLECWCSHATRPSCRHSPPFRGRMGATALAK